MRKTALALSMLLLLAAAAAWAEPTSVQTVEGYLAKMKVAAKQPTPGEFQFKLGFPNAKAESFLVRVLPANKVVYVAILEVQDLPFRGPRSEGLFRELAKLNFQLTVGKLEWEPEKAQVRLSYTFASEQEIDQASFVAVIQTLLSEVEQVRAKLQQVK
ncbi:MAG: hypothetical protein GX444_19700 [Myxococcales bacterium]|nr:hypothetical protein [Myxococcales bacterium]